MLELTGAARSSLHSKQMSTFLTRRDARQQLEDKRREDAQKKEEKRFRKLRHKDLFWACKRRFLNDNEWYELHLLDREFGKWGPEQAEHEFGKLEQLREYWRRHGQIKEGDPHLDALQKHLALHQEQQEIKEKGANKKIVKAHPSEKLLDQK